MATEGAGKGLDATRIAVAGDSVGGNMSAALTLMAKERGGVQLRGQVLFYPVTDANFDTASYHQFVEGNFLRCDAMQWFWDQYTPPSGPRSPHHRCAPPSTSSAVCRRPSSSPAKRTCCVTRARSTRTSSAIKLREAGVPVTAVRCQGLAGALGTN